MKKGGGGGYSYNLHGSSDNTAKRSIGSPKAVEPSLLPAAKRRFHRGGMDVIRPSADGTPAASFMVRGQWLPLRPMLCLLDQYSYI